jgi:hypothetical protein
MSEELLQMRFGHDPEMESIRINREQKSRDNGWRAPKASPYHDPQFGIALKKIALQTGVITPGQAGITPDAGINDMKMYDKQKGEKTSLEMRATTTTKEKGPAPAYKAVTDNGRPKNARDKSKRKTPTFKPKTKAKLEVWLKDAQNIIAKSLNDIYLQKVGKSNLRMLTNAQTKELEKIKFGVLFNLSPMAKANDSAIFEALGKEIPSKLHEVYQVWAGEITKELDRPLTFEELKQIQISLYTENYLKSGS